VATADLFGQQIQYALDTLADHTQTSVLTSASTVVGQRSATFDALGRILQSIGGVGQTTTFAYDANGNRTSVSDPLGRVTHQAFDALNRRTQITDPASGVTAIAYDAQDHPVAIIDPNGNVTSYVYDGFGDLIGQTSPDSGTTVSYYDAAGNLMQRVDARGAVTNYAYDALNRLTSRTYRGSPSENVTFTYDEAGHGFGIGRLTTLVDNGGTTGALARSYDERGNVVSAVRRAGTVTLATAYAYDAASRVAAVTYPSGWTAAYTRDQMGRVTAIGAQPPGPAPPRAGRLASFGEASPALGLPAASVPLTVPPGASAPVASAISYLPFGPVSGLSYGNGVVETRAFDLDYRATGIADTGAATMQNLSYSYDAANNVISIADGVTPGNSQSFGYDALDRLVSAAGGYGSLAYAYDPVGNRLTSTANDGYQSATVNFSYAAGSSRLAALMQGGAAIRQFSYTASGDAASDLLLQGGAWVGNGLQYNQAGRLATVVTQGSGKASQSTSYAYDAFGQRLLKQGPPGLRFYQYDQAGHLLEEGSLANGSAASERDYIYLGTGRSPRCCPVPAPCSSCTATGSTRRNSRPTVPSAPSGRRPTSRSARSGRSSSTSRKTCVSRASMPTRKRGTTTTASAPTPPTSAATSKATRSASGAASIPTFMFARTRSIGLTALDCKLRMQASEMDGAFRGDTAPKPVLVMGGGFREYRVRELQRPTIYL
jgi:YD repeat-containing protein